MKLWVISDLHLEMGDVYMPALPDADVCVCAGDITNGVANAVHWLNDMVAPVMPCVFVPGNHEFYSHSILEGREWGQVAAQECPSVHLLDDAVAVIGGVRFVGATLWTDFALDGRAEREVAWAAANFEGRINDSRAIAWRKLPVHEAFTARRVQELHQRSRAFLRRELKAGFDGPTVVITHHAPHPKSVNEKWKGSSLNASFASDLSEMVELWRPALWVHGHMHDSCDYTVRNTRVLCNPKGYGSENARFDPGLVVEI